MNYEYIDGDMNLIINGSDIDSIHLFLSFINRRELLLYLEDLCKYACNI